MNTITQNFKKFEVWLKENWIDGYNALNPPATDKDIQELKDTLGFNVPKDLEELLRCHNGQKDDTQWLFEHKEFLSTKRIIQEYNDWKEMAVAGDFEGFTTDTSKEIYANIWWNTKWIPFTYDGAGNHICIDMNPTE